MAGLSEAGDEPLKKTSFGNADICKRLSSDFTREDFQKASECLKREDAGWREYQKKNIIVTVFLLVPILLVVCIFGDAIRGVAAGSFQKKYGIRSAIMESTGWNVGLQNDHIFLIIFIGAMILAFVANLFSFKLEQEKKDRLSIAIPSMNKEKRISLYAKIVTEEKRIQNNLEFADKVHSMRLSSVLLPRKK